MSRRRAADAPIRPSRLDGRDLAAEALAGLLRHPGRALLTSLGTTLGVATFVAVLGLAATAAARVDSRFHAVTGAEVVVEDAGTRDASDPFPPDAETRVRQVNGVVGGGVYRRVPQRSPVRAGPAGVDVAAADVSVFAASPGLFTVVQPRLAAGRTFDAFHDRTGARVAVLGAGVARRLGVGSLDTPSAVFINDVRYTVIGLLDRVERLPELTSAVTIPTGSLAAVASTSNGGDAPKMLVVTRLGAAPQVAEELPLALRPDAPDALRVLPPTDPGRLPDAVRADLGAYFLILAGLCLLVGAVGIANTTLLAVRERMLEIGLRRALGATRRQVTAHVLAESAALGGLGGLFGCCTGVITVVGVAVALGWTPVAEPWTIALAPPLGIVVGMAAGAYPAIRAGRIEPAEALRR
ncbi:putative ABC transport system permease protein [Micromonospora pattaloongensis]|uniref:Putative ABC transport system permease protein n=1 Tax=Micromonospora pattaloongensis TaxID=405436 RepID=A0A1H3TCJ6_9ACTN|nr:ABC transporter permease [Micromonospora pattaloongensis]SDZ47425.1 putative ABC transport system permease protein [Micromonospora pattaloongensis]